MKLNMLMAGTVAAAFVLCGCATTSPNATAKPPVSAVVDPNCLADTGSRIAEGKSNCRSFGRSYTDEDISRTGRTSAADALSQLDPSITVHR